jgi:hypothetical protein
MWKNLRVERNFHANEEGVVVVAVRELFKEFKRSLQRPTMKNFHRLTENHSNFWGLSTASIFHSQSSFTLSMPKTYTKAQKFLIIFPAFHKRIQFSSSSAAAQNSS